MSPSPTKPDKRILRYLTWYQFTQVAGTPEDDSILQRLDKANLGGFGSLEALYRIMAADGFPVCPECGETPVRQEHMETHKKKAKPEGGEHRQKLPPAAAAIPDFRKVLRHLEERELPYLSAEESWLEGKASDGSFRGKRFISRSTWNESFTMYKEEYSAESWAELCARYGTDPKEQDQLSVPEPQRALGGVSGAPSDRLVALIAISALTPITISSNPFAVDMPFEDIVRSLHLDPENIDWDQINKKTANLERAARHLAVLVHGGTVGSGTSYSKLSEREHFLVDSIDELHALDLSDEEVADHINAKFFSDFNGVRHPDRKSADDIRRIRAFGLEDLD